MMNNVAKRGTKRLFLLQLAVTSVMSLVFSSGWVSVYSAWLGGAVCILPMLYFSRKLFKHRGARQANKIVKSFYVGEAIKIALSVALFALVFLTVVIDPVAFFTTFIVVQCMHWFAPWLFAK